MADVNEHELDAILLDWNAIPKAEMIHKLATSKSIDQLTTLRLAIVDRCKGIKDFPNSELYLRRKPKNSSQFSSLEERLAADICELLCCLDTNIVTPEIKAMFKHVASTIPNNAGGNDVIPGLTFIAPPSPQVRHLIEKLDGME